jgi:hypothetical protein
MIQKTGSRWRGSKLTNTPTDCEFPESSPKTRKQSYRSWSDDPTNDPLADIHLHWCSCRRWQCFGRLLHAQSRPEICAYSRSFWEWRRKESVSAGGQRVVIHSGLGSGKFFLGLRGSPISSTVSLNSGVKMKRFWGTVKNPQERTMAESLATGGDSRGNMLADGF